MNKLTSVSLDELATLNQDDLNERSDTTRVLSVRELIILLTRHVEDLDMPVNVILERQPDDDSEDDDDNHQDGVIITETSIGVARIEITDNSTLLYLCECIDEETEDNSE